MESIYEVLLNRPTDAAVATYVNHLNSGISPTNVVLAIEGTTEYRTDLLQSLYQRYLDRQADAGGLQYFLNQLANGSTVEQVETALVSSPEYYQLHGSNNGNFLQALYQDGLGRQPDTAGLDYFTVELATGVTRATVVAQVFGSGEFQQDLIGPEFQGVLGREATAADLGYFQGLLQTGTSDQSLLAILPGSPEAYNKRS